MSASVRPPGGRIDRWAVPTLAPVLAVYALLAVVPLASLLVMSVHDIRWEGGRAIWRAVGADHYAALPSDQLVRVGIWNTTVFAVVAVGIEMLLGFVLALMISRVGRGRLFYQTVIYPYKGELERWYNAHRSVATDLKIMALTVVVVLFPASEQVFRTFPDLPLRPAALRSREGAGTGIPRPSADTSAERDELGRPGK